jgi:hypothetical protein
MPNMDSVEMINKSAVNREVFLIDLRDITYS